MIDPRVLQAPGAPLFASLSPVWAGFARGLVWAVATAVVTAVITYLSAGTLPSGYEWLGAPLVLVLRSLEGWLDQRSVERGAAAVDAVTGPTS